jgi:hypothetical protein
MEFSGGKMFMKPAGSSEPFTELGEVGAMILTMTDGTKIRSGDRAELFELEQTPEDQALLADMLISTRLA